MAGKVDLNIEQGATYRRALLWRQPQTPAQIAAGEPGTPYPLAGCRATMQIRTKVNGNILLSLFDGDGITLGYADPITGDPVEGGILIELDSQRTLALELKRAGAYDLYVIFPEGGDVRRVAQGAVIVDLTVTDPVDA